MTLLTLLAATGTGTTPPDPEGLAPVTDAYLAPFRPPRAATVTVGPPGSGAEHETMAAGIAAAAAHPARSATAFVWVAVHPGTYVLPGDTHLHLTWDGLWIGSTTGNPADVTIRSTGTNLGVIWARRRLYLEGITLNAQGGSKYALHITPNDANCTIVAARCTIASSSPGVGAAGALGQDAQPSGLAILADCEVTATGGTVSMITHGLDGAATPTDLVFKDCTIGGPINYSASGQPDRVWVPGTTSTACNAPGAVVHTNGASSVGTITSASTATNGDSHPMPVWT